VCYARALEAYCDSLEQAEPAVWDPQGPACGGSRRVALSQQAEPVVDGENLDYLTRD
jgi:hypothetical protein